MGVHTVSVKHRDIHIPGSPLGKLKSYRPSHSLTRVSFSCYQNSPWVRYKAVVHTRFVLVALVSFVVKSIQRVGRRSRSTHSSPCALSLDEFNIYTREAGAGGLSIAVEGPAKAEIDFFDRKDGSCGVAYVCPEAGDYQITIKFNDQHIPDSPFNVTISPPFGEAKKLTIHSLTSKELEINKDCTFTVKTNGARGRLEARAVAPSGAEETCIVQEMADDHHTIRFVPKENGIHWIHVRFNGRDIPESPFRVVVGQSNADPGRVFASGAGLYQGETGERK